MGSRTPRIGYNAVTSRGGKTLSPQLIVSGMHRSGTSLAASVLQEAGLDIGLKDSDPRLGVGQPRGHFEAPDFHALHEAILADSGQTCFTADDDALGGVGGVPLVFEEQARALAEARADRPFWGWKDPRTCLFLDLWDRLLPRARYLFLYRHPVDVALSLWRRNTDPELRRDRWQALRAWELYNRRLLAFRDRHPERCFVAHAPGFAADLPGFLRRLAARLDLPLRGGNFHALYDAEELAPSCRPSRFAWEELIPEALTLYDRLEEIADLPSSEEPVASGRQLSMVQGSENLLYKLLKTNHDEEIEAKLELARLQPELARLKLQEEELRQRLGAAEEEARVLRQVLEEIEGSRSYSLIRAWWRLRRHLTGPQRSARPAEVPLRP